MKICYPVEVSVSKSSLVCPTAEATATFQVESSEGPGWTCPHSLMPLGIEDNYPVFPQEP
jgi:hypothetical protein